MVSQQNTFKNTIVILIFLLSVTVLNTRAHACPSRTDIPGSEGNDQYHSIFFAKVESFSWVPSIFLRSDLTGSYNITISEDIKVKYGATPIAREYTIEGGCGEPIPEIGEIGHFFQKHKMGEIKALRYFRSDSLYHKLYIDGSPKADEKAN